MIPFCALSVKIYMYVPEEGSNELKHVDSPT